MMTQGEDDCLQAKEEASEETSLADTLPLTSSLQAVMQ